MTRILILGILILSACSPVPPGATSQNSPGAIQGIAPAISQTPRPIPPPTIDQRGTQAAMDLQSQILKATSQAEAIQATQTAIASLALANAVATSAESTQRAWIRDGATMTAGVVQDTATTRAMNTATALYAPVLSASRTALANKVSIDDRSTQIRLKAEPYRQAVPLIGFVLISYGIYLLCRSVAVYIWRKAFPPPEPEYSDPIPDRSIQDKPPAQEITIYHGLPGQVESGFKSRLPCTDREMSLLALWVITRHDRSLAINKWEDRGLSGRIPEIREWFLDQGYAEKDNNNYIEINEKGTEFLAAWMGTHPPTRPVQISPLGA